MIKQVTIKNFKRFREVTFDLPGHIVVAGPNNMGKTTLLQAIAAWGLALNRWKEVADPHKHKGAYTRAPLARQAFSAVPLRGFDLLWTDRKARLPIEIIITSDRGWTIGMELIPDSSEQVYVRPLSDTEQNVLQENDLMETVYIPPMTGLSTDEPEYRRPKVDQLLGQGKPGEIIRNLLVEAHQSEEAWSELSKCIDRMFRYEILPPDATGADIIAEYRERPGGPRLDVASAGSGFQQVLMLLTFLHTRGKSVLLLDEPDAHLHIILQDVIFSELHTVALKKRSQLIVATHSEIIINSVEPRLLCAMLATPRLLDSVADQASLVAALSVLTPIEIMEAVDAPGVVYLEGHTDLSILREWARILNHPALETLTTKLFWQATNFATRFGAKGKKSKEHYDALQLIKKIPGLELIDGDAHPDIQDKVTGEGLQRLRWRRYEIESYLVHPHALERYVEKVVGKEAAAPHIADLRKYLDDNFPPAAIREPLGDHAFLNTAKARSEILPPALAAAGLPGIPYTEYHEIAAVMLPEEIHPEVTEKLNGIQKAFGL
jgi:AAA domain, putative AbiEii toxin, Type IV TA system/AAA ATPase domain